jgi:O-6-methylguanine DNA methyltransferase
MLERDLYQTGHRLFRQRGQCSLASGSVCDMISIYVKKVEGSWFGLAYVGEEIVATALALARDETVRSLVKSIPFDVQYQIVEEGTEFTERTISMLKELESGEEKSKSFSLSAEYVPEPMAKVLKAAAAIPIGYVTSYGNIAKASDTEPRIVGRIMATNPLYPVVPCHRVVGADFSLVGYGGGKTRRALQAKLVRLSKEAKGFDTSREVEVNGRKLAVYPVECVIRKAKKQGLAHSGQQ